MSHPATRFSLQGSCPAPCFYTFRRTPALHPATPFEKGVDPKTFLRTDNILSMEGLRTRNAGAVDFRVPQSMGTGRYPFFDTFRRAPALQPCFYTFRRAPALHPATPFEKWVDPKTFWRTDDILLTERHKIRNAGAVDFRVPQSMGAGRYPFFDTFRRAPPCNPATPFEKGGRSENFFGGQTTYL